MEKQKSNKKIAPAKWADKQRDAIYKNMTPAEKWAAVGNLYSSALALKNLF